MSGVVTREQLVVAARRADPGAGRVGAPGRGPDRHVLRRQDHARRRGGRRGRRRRPTGRTGRLRRLPPPEASAATGWAGPRPRATWTTRSTPTRCAGWCSTRWPPAGRPSCPPSYDLAGDVPVDPAPVPVAAGSVVLVEGSFLLVAGPGRPVGPRRCSWSPTPSGCSSGRWCATRTWGRRPGARDVPAPLPGGRVAAPGARRPVVARRRGRRPHRPGRAPPAELTG